MIAAKVFERLRTLPPMPAVALRLLDAAKDPDVDLANVARWIERDPATTANLLRLCNSPFYGLRSQVSSVRQAVSLLGMKQVVQMALAILSSRYLTAAQAGYGLAPGELLRNSVAAATACEILALEVRYKDPAGAYTAGLLQDIGKVVLAEFVDLCGRNIWAVAEERSLAFHEAERELIGTSHAEVGASLLDAWGFPEPLIEAVRLHHNPAEATVDPVLARISHLADALTMTLGVGLGRDGLAYRLDEEAVRALGLSEGRKLDHLMETFAAGLHKAEALLATVGDERT